MPAVEGNKSDRQEPKLPFKNCLGHSGCRKGCIFLQDTITLCNDENSTRPYKSEPALPFCDEIKLPSSSECSNHSTRNVNNFCSSYLSLRNKFCTISIYYCILFFLKVNIFNFQYKFVNPWELNLSNSGEEEEPENSPIICESCVTDEEEEAVQEEPDVEYTLAIIKPEAIIYRKEIERRIYEECFEVCQTRWLQLTPEQASEFYSDSYRQINFAHLVEYMASGPIVAMVLAKQQAVEDWRMLMGPTKVIFFISFFLLNYIADSVSSIFE